MKHRGASGWKGPHLHLHARFREHGMLYMVETVLLGHLGPGRTSPTLEGSVCALLREAINKIV